MSSKVYVWGFPGVGKSSLRSSLNITDADSRMFMFDGVSPESLHQAEDREGVRRQQGYPENYLEHIRNTNADIVLLNCHVSHLNGLDPENLLLIYPAKELKGEYISRYHARGDHASFIQHMEECFDDMVDAIAQAPFRKLMLTDPKTTLQSLLDGGALMSQFITKKELTNLLEESIRYGVFTPAPAHAGKSPDQLAQMVFEGEVELDLAVLRKNHARANAEEEQELLRVARRGGLTHEALRERIQTGIVQNVFFIEHGQIAPYQYGYEVMYPNDRFAYQNRWECYNCGLSEVAEKITCMIEKDQQDKEVFSSTQLQPLDIQKLLSDIAEKEKHPLESFTEAAKTNYEPRGRYTGHVATLKDVQNGIALDGIARGKFRGDYSSITTNRQNDLMRALVFLKGFCLDCLSPGATGPFSALEKEDQAFVIAYLKAHGTDISTPDKLKAWILKNPGKCALPENRQRAQAFDQKVESASQRRTAQNPKQSERNAEKER